MCDKLTILSSLNKKGRKEGGKKEERKKRSKEGRREGGRKEEERKEKKALTVYLFFTSLEALCHILLSVVGIIKTQAYKKNPL